MSGKSAHKTDEHDARSVAITAAHHHGLQRVTAEDATAVIGMVLDRRWQLVSQRQRTIVRLHATLAELIPAGARIHLKPTKAAALLRTVRPATAVQAERKQMCQEMLPTGAG